VSCYIIILYWVVSQVLHFVILGWWGGGEMTQCFVIRNYRLPFFCMWRGGRY